jgi:hypothetical protein
MRIGGSSAKDLKNTGSGRSERGVGRERRRGSCTI